MELHSLQNTARPYKRRKLLGRGIGSGRGKTCCRGHKGAGSRAGWKSRDRYEGGQLPLYRKLPKRGFTNARFSRPLDAVTLAQIDAVYEDGEAVNVQTLYEKGLVTRRTYGVKLLSNGELTKKITIEVQAISQQAASKLEKAGISCTCA